MSDLKELSNNIAKQLLANSNQSEIDFDLSYDFFSRVSEADAVETKAVQQIEEDSIGIWVREGESEDEYFRNVEKISEWKMWSSTPSIQLKTDKKRLVLLGESVARGYLYDPYYNVAKALEGALTREQEGYDVVDLAKVSIEMDELTNLTLQSLKLKPEYLVVFAGNNWFNSYRKGLNDDDVEQIEKIITENFSDSDLEGSFLNSPAFDKISKHFHNGIKKLVIEYLELLARISKDHGIEVIFVLPEYNLTDWKATVAEESILRIPLKKLTKWVALKQESTEYLSKGDFSKAIESARSMIECDPSHPLAYQIIAAAEEKRNNAHLAYDFFSLARDTCVFNRSMSQARILDVISETLIEESERLKLGLINLPEVFKDYLDGELPGRNIFIDYCHLNEIGINLVAESVAQSITKTSVDSPNPVKPSDQVRALAHLSAAVHNAHYGQHSEILNYLCETAIESQPEVAIDFMKCYIDFSSRKVSNLICKSHETLIDNELLNQFDSGHGFRHAKYKKMMDLELVDVMTDLLNKRNIDINESIDDIRAKNHGVAGRKIDLLESYYSKYSFDKVLNDRESVYRASNLESSFILISDENHDVNVQITYRTPGRQHDKDFVEFYINDEYLTSLKQSSNWNTKIFTIKADKVKAGVNKLIIKWPFNTPIKFEELLPQEKSVDMIMQRMMQVFGEIHSFTAEGSKTK
ncbi:MAG: hypothetical protein AAFN93_11095 [Bacteroidota bacterium]